MPARAPAGYRSAQIGYLNQAFLTDLARNTQYYYVVGSAAQGWAGPFSFVNEVRRAPPRSAAGRHAGGARSAACRRCRVPQPSTRSPIYAIYADFGLTNDE